MTLQPFGLWLPQGAVLSHASAARLWELPLPHNLDDVVHATVPMSRSRWRTTTAEIHRRDLRPGEQTELDGLQVTSPLRTLLDLALVWESADSVAAADCALHEGLVGLEELTRATSGLRGRGAGRIGLMGSLVDPAAESPLESAVRVLLSMAGFRPEESQLSLYDGGLFVGRFDFAWPRFKLVVEADGFAFHSDRDVFRSDRDKANALERLDWALLRFTWEHVHLTPQRVIDDVRDTLRRQELRAA